MKIKGHTKSNAHKLAQPIRQMCQKLLRDKVKTKEDRLRLAKSLGKSPGAVGGMLYQARGGFDTLIAAVIVAYNLNDDAIEDFLTSAFKHFKSRSKADKKWEDNDKYYSDQEKLNWATIMEIYGQLSSKLKSEDKKST